MKKQQIVLFLLLLNTICFSQRFFQGDTQADSYECQLGGQSTVLNVRHEFLVVKFEAVANRKEYRLMPAALQQFLTDPEAIHLINDYYGLKLVGGLTGLQLKELINEIENEDSTIHVGLAVSSGIGELQFLTESFFVKVGSRNDLAQLEKYAETYGFSIQSEFRLNVYFCSLGQNNEFNTLDVCLNLQQHNAFEYVEPNFVIGCKHATNDEKFDDQWAIKNTGQEEGTPGADIDIENAWDITAGDASIKVSVLDCWGSLSQLLHPDISITQYYDATGDNDWPASSYLNTAHGINCAGLIAATTNNSIGIAGIAYECEVIAVKLGDAITNSNWQPEFNWWSLTSSLADGIQWAYENSDIISNSNGFGSWSTVITDEIDAALVEGRNGKGTLFISSTGNDYSSSIGFPASYVNTIAVGASTNTDHKADFSNYGNGLDVCAPGSSNIWSTDIAGSEGYSNGDYHPFDGTSAACPIVAAVMALILSADPELGYEEARQILETSCEKVGGYPYIENPDQPNGTWCNNLGYGRINAYEALLLTTECAGSPSTPVAIAPGTSNFPGELLTSLTQTFSWQPVSNVVYYRLSISQYPFGTQNLVFTECIEASANSYEIGDGILEWNKYYRWDVQASNGEDCGICASGYSADRYFNTITDTEADPQPELSAWAGNFYVTSASDATWSYSVGNDGTGYAAPFTISFYLCSNANCTNPMTIGSQYVSGGLSSGAVFNYANTFNLCSAGIVPDYYYLGFTIDVNVDVNEIDENNNEEISSNSFTFECQTEIDAANLHPINEFVYSTGNTLSFQFNVDNNGTTWSGDYQISYFVSSTPSVTDAIFLTNEPMPSLQNGLSVPVFSFVDFCLYDLPNGTYYYGFFIDHIGEVTETNETDNWYVHPTPVETNCNASIPDLVVTYASPNFVSNSLSWDFTIHNYGNQTSPETTVAFYVMTTPFLPEDEPPVETATVPAIGINDHHDGFVSINMCNTGLADGLYYIAMKVNANENFDEWTYLNNSSVPTWMAINVLCSPLPDLHFFQIGSVFVDGEIVDFNLFWCGNQGDEWSSPCEAYIFTSSDSNFGDMEIIGTGYPINALSYTGLENQQQLDLPAVSVCGSGVGGTAYVGIWLDYSDQIIELDEENNIYYHPNPVDCGVGVNEISSDEILNVVPNPNDGTFSIQCESVRNGSVGIEILNALGEIVYNQKIFSTTTGLRKEIQLNCVANGVYLVKVSTERGNSYVKVQVNR